MKTKIFVLSCTILTWMCLPFPAIAEEIIEEEELPMVLMTELSLNPMGNDVQWIEIHNQGDEDIDLTDWMIGNLNDSTVELSGLIYPDEYRVFFWNENLFSSTDTIQLINDQEDIIEEWALDVLIEPGQSLIPEDDQIMITDLPTAGRPNVLHAREVLMCEEIENETENEPDEDETEEETPELQTGNIILNEIFANPETDEGENEFIELFNNETMPINLDQWIIADASKSFTLSEITIPAQSHIVLPRTLTSIALNNGSETVTLTDSFGAEIDLFSYESTTEGMSYNYQPVDIWYEALPSPGEPNSNRPPDPVEESEEEDPAPDDDTSPADTNDTPADQPAPDDNPPNLDPNLDQVILNELIPNPEGSDDQEWIELYNPTEFTLKLSGLTISDPTRDYLIAEGEIRPDGYLVIKREDSKIALNNSGDTISLGINDVVTDDFTYTESNEGSAWARQDDGEWAITMEPTPDEANYFPAEDESQAATSKTSTSATSKKTTSSKKDIKQINIPEWDAIEDGENVSVTGVLTVKPGTFNKRQAIIQDPEHPVALELYFHKAEWPDLDINMLITVMGEKSVTKNGSRLLIRAQSDVRAGDAIDFEPYSISSLDLDDSMQQVLVKIEGTLIEQNKNELLIGFDSQEITASLKAAGLVISQKAENSPVIVSGVLEKKDESWEIWPRNKNEILIEAVTVEIDELIVSETIPQPDINQSGPTRWISWLWLILGAAASASVLLFVIYRDLIVEQVREKIYLIISKTKIWLKPIQPKPSSKS